jgi:hypothetical protein
MGKISSMNAYNAAQQVIQQPEKALEGSQAFLDFLVLHKQVADAWERVEAALLTSRTKSVKGEWGSLSIGERKSWHVETELPPEYYKKQLDTKKLNALYNADILPTGVDYTVTAYMTRRLK